MQLFSRFPFEFPTVLAAQSPSPSSPSTLPPASALATDAMREELQRRAMLAVGVRVDMGGEGGGGASCRTVSVKVAPLAVFVEDTFVHKMSQVAASFDIASSSSLANQEEDEDDFEENDGDPSLLLFRPSLPASVSAAAANLSHRLCLDEVLLEPVDVSLSLHASVKMHIGLEQSPLSFAAFRRARLRSTGFDLGQALARHYISGALFRAGWVVGSLVRRYSYFCKYSFQYLNCFYLRP